MPYWQTEEDFYYKIKLDSRKRFRRNTGILCIIFFIALVVLAIIGSSQVLLVSILYLCILSEGICLAAFIAFYDVNWGVEAISSIILGKRRVPEEEPRGRDVAASMDVFVKYAVRGSDYSRREVAFVIQGILEKSGSMSLQTTRNSSLIQEDLKRVVFSYTLEKSSNNSRNGRLISIGRRVPNREREAYLQSLERIIKYLQSI